MIKLIRFILGFCNHNWQVVQRRDLNWKDDGSFYRVHVVSICKKCGKSIAETL